MVYYVTFGDEKITIEEKDTLGNELFPTKTGALSLEEGLLVMTITPEPVTENVGYILLTGDGEKLAMQDFPEKEFLNDPETKFADVTLDDASNLSSGYEYSLFGILSGSTTTYSADILSADEVGDTFTKTTSYYDKSADKLMLQERQKTITVQVVEEIEPEKKADHEIMRFKYVEVEPVVSEYISYWYRYDKETDTLELYTGTEPLKFTRSK